MRNRLLRVNSMAVRRGAKQRASPKIAGSGLLPFQRSSRRNSARRSLSGFPSSGRPSRSTVAERSSVRRSANPSEASRFKEPPRGAGGPIRATATPRTMISKHPPRPPALAIGRRAAATHVYQSSPSTTRYLRGEPSLADWSVCPGRRPCRSPDRSLFSRVGSAQVVTQPPLTSMVAPLM